MKLGTVDSAWKVTSLRKQTVAVPVKHTEEKSGYTRTRTIVLSRHASRKSSWLMHLVKRLRHQTLNWSTAKHAKDLCASHAIVLQNKSTPTASNKSKVLRRLCLWERQTSITPYRQLKPKGFLHKNSSVQRDRLQISGTWCSTTMNPGFKFTTLRTWWKTSRR